MTPTLRGILGGCALAALALLTLKQCHSEELAVTKCGHLVKIYRMPEVAVQAVGDEIGAEYTAWAVAIPEVGIVWVRNDRPNYQLPLGHEYDHIDGMKHDAWGRITVPPSCGRN